MKSKVLFGKDAFPTKLSEPVRFIRVLKYDDDSGYVLEVVCRSIYLSKETLLETAKKLAREMGIKKEKKAKKK